MSDVLYGAGIALLVVVIVAAWSAYGIGVAALVAIVAVLVGIFVRLGRRSGGAS